MKYYITMNGCIYTERELIEIYYVANGIYPQSRSAEKYIKTLKGVSYCTETPPLLYVMDLEPEEKAIEIYKDIKNVTKSQAVRDMQYFKSRVTLRHGYTLMNDHLNSNRGDRKGKFKIEDYGNEIIKKVKRAICYKGFYYYSDEVDSIEEFKTKVNIWEEKITAMKDEAFRMRIDLAEKPIVKR